MKNLLLLGLLILSFYSCITKENENINRENDVLEVKLNKTIDSDILFNLKKTDFLLYPYKEKYPKYYDELIKKYKNLPKSDSLFVVSHSFQMNKFYYKLYKGNHLTNSYDKSRALHFLKDTLQLSKKFTKHQINALSWHKNNRTIITIDANNNSDFRDDQSLIFNKNFGFENNMIPDSKIIDTLPIIDIKYQVDDDGRVIDMNRKVQVFPYPNYFLTQIYESAEMKDYALLLRFKDYWKGNLTKDNTVSVPKNSYGEK